MLPGDQLVCAFVTSRYVGDTFRKWPLHVTIVPWFKLKIPAEDFVALLQGDMQGVSPFGAKVRFTRRFGHRRANVLLKNQWQPIHDVALKIVQQSAKNRAPFRFVGKRYSPHVTHQATEHVSEGDIFWCDKVYIVEQKGNYKEIIAEIHLGS